MERDQLRRQVAILRKSLIDQGYLGEQFIYLEELQGSNIAEGNFKLFFSEFPPLILDIEQALVQSPLNFRKLDSYMHRFKSRSAQIGALKVKDEITQFGKYCQAENAEGCMRTFQQVKNEYATLRQKLENYFQLVRQAGPAEIACPASCSEFVSQPK